MCLMALTLERRQWIPILRLVRHLARPLVTPPASAAISMCLLVVTCRPVLVSRLLIRALIGCILILGLMSLAGCMISLMILLFDPVSLYLLGAVEMRTACGVWCLYLLKCRGWPLSVDGSWKLHLISALPCEWLFPHTVLSRGTAMRDLLMMSSVLGGRQLNSAGGGLLVLCLARRCEQPLTFR